MTNSDTLKKFREAKGIYERFKKGEITKEEMDNYSVRARSTITAALARLKKAIPGNKA